MESMITRCVTTLLVLTSLAQLTYTFSQSNEYDLVDLKLIPKRQYFDSLGGMALGKRARSNYLFDPYQADYSLWMKYRPQAGRYKRQYFDSLGGMALGKRELYILRRPTSSSEPGALFELASAKEQATGRKVKRQYFDSLGGMALGKRRGPPFNMFRGTALGKRHLACRFRHFWWSHIWHIYGQNSCPNESVHEYILILSMSFPIF